MNMRIGRPRDARYAERKTDFAFVRIHHDECSAIACGTWSGDHCIAAEVDGKHHNSRGRRRRHVLRGQLRRSRRLPRRFSRRLPGRLGRGLSKDVLGHLLERFFRHLLKRVLRRLPERNNLGVLEYDGAAWRLIKTGSSVVRALDRDAAGRIYVGAFGDMGYLAPDESGELQFVSLRDLVPEEDRAFNDVWTVHATDGGVYFQARERLMRLTPNEDGWSVKVWRPEERFMFAFLMGGTYYVVQGGVGLMKMEGDLLEPVPGGELFANDRTQVMLP